MWSVTCVGGAICVAVSETKITRHMAAMGDMSHDNTRRMHKDFHRALLAMVNVSSIILASLLLCFAFGFAKSRLWVQKTDSSAKADHLAPMYGARTSVKVRTVRLPFS